MKRITYLLLVLFSVLLVACEDQFLEPKQKKPVIPEPEPELPVEPVVPRSNIVFNIDNKSIRLGEESDSEVFLTIDANYIRLGDDPKGEILYNIHGRYIKEGRNTLGEILFTIDGNYIRAGREPDGTILFHLDGNNIRMGADDTDRTLGTIWYNTTLYTYDYAISSASMSKAGNGSIFRMKNKYSDNFPSWLFSADIITPYGNNLYYVDYKSSANDFNDYPLHYYVTSAEVRTKQKNILFKIAYSYYSIINYPHMTRSSATIYTSKGGRLFKILFSNTDMGHRNYSYLSKGEIYYPLN